MDSLPARSMLIGGIAVIANGHIRTTDDIATVGPSGSTRRRCACHPEDLVIYKLVAARPIDLEDARQLVLLHHHDIARRRVAQVLGECDLALEDDRSRVELWEQLARGAYPA